MLSYDWKAAYSRAATRLIVRLSSSLLGSVLRWCPTGVCWLLWQIAIQPREVQVSFHTFSLATYLRSERVLEVVIPTFTLCRFVSSSLKCRKKMETIRGRLLYLVNLFASSLLHFGPDGTRDERRITCLTWTASNQSFSFVTNLSPTIPYLNWTWWTWTGGFHQISLRILWVSIFT